MTETSTRLAVERTRLAHDRTLMAWVRTVTSLISFGFTIYKFFQYLRDQGKAPEGQRFGPREFALAMIGFGLVALIIATYQHIRDMRALRREHASVPYSLAGVMAGLVGILGVLAFLAVIFKK